jgi:DNA-binding transcriptional MerR regulator
MTIGEASRRSGFTVKALRFYEHRGILPPSNRRPNGYRVYCETDLGRLSFIRDAKALGLTLGAIGELLGAPNGSMRRRLLQVLDDRYCPIPDPISDSRERSASLEPPMTGFGELGARCRRQRLSGFSSRRTPMSTSSHERRTHAQTPKARSLPS